MKKIGMNFIILIIAVAMVLGCIVAMATYRQGYDKAVAVFRAYSPKFLTVNDKDGEDYETFKDFKFEMIRIVYNDGVWFQLTSLEKVRISITGKEIIRLTHDFFRRDVGDIKIIVHNHFTQKDLGEGYTNAKPYNFSPADFDELKILRDAGFKGQYCIWVKGQVIVEGKQ
jgi:hypothetical protein